MATGSDIVAATRADFERHVLEGSATRPVLVDFWAAWCGPCRTLAPLLEQLAERFAGRLAVVKVDSDAEPELAARYGVRSLPTLLLFKAGTPVDQLIGAQPLAALAAFVEPHLARDSDRLRSEAAALAGRDPEAAVRLFEQALASDPENTRIHPQLAALLIDRGDLARAQAVLDALPSRAAGPDSQRQAARLRFAQAAAGGPPPAELAGRRAAGQTDAETMYYWAIGRILAADHSAALDALLGIVRSDRRFGDDLARKTVLDVFALLEPDDPRIREYRTALARALN